MHNSEKSVSVYVPTRNRPNHLGRALDSLVNQTHRHFQVLVCDDASEPKYSRVVTEYKNKFADLVYLKNQTKIGACASRNRMIAAADGDYVTGLDDDDYFAPHRLSDFVNFRSIDDYAFLCSTTIPICGDTDTGSIFDTGSLFTGSEIYLQNLKRYNAVGSQAFIKKQYLKEISGFDSGMPAWQDFDVWFRLILARGPGYKLYNNSYYIDQSKSRPRISTSLAAVEGFYRFVEKHAHCLSPTDIAHLQLRDYENRNAAIEFKNFRASVAGLNIVDKTTLAWLYLKQYIGAEYPGVKKHALQWVRPKRNRPRKN